MPQVFQVLKCYKCFVFQIHQTKKSIKFECKMCGEKQSIKRHYGLGSGKDCRMHVQKLNVLRGNKDMEHSIKSSSDEENEEIKGNKKISGIKNSVLQCSKQSKWSPFEDKNEETEATEEPMFLENKEVYLEIPKKRKICKSKVAQATKSEYVYSKYPSMVELKSTSAFSNDITDDLCLAIPDDNNDISSNNDIATSNNEYKKQQKYTRLNNVIEKKPPEPLILHTVKKNSIWAQFLDSKEDNNGIHRDMLTNCDVKESVSTLDNLFSLCDDNDIDRLLDI